MEEMTDRTSHVHKSTSPSVQISQRTLNNLLQILLLKSKQPNGILITLKSIPRPIGKQKLLKIITKSTVVSSSKLLVSNPLRLCAADVRHLELVSGQFLHDCKNLILGCGDAGDVEILVGCLLGLLKNGSYGFADIWERACRVRFVAGVYEAEFPVLDVDETEGILEAL